LWNDTYEQKPKPKYKHHKTLSLVTYYPAMQYIIPISMVIMALFGAQTGIVSGIPNDILVNQFAKSYPAYQNNADCGSFDEIELPPACKKGYQKTFTALAYGSLVKETFSIIGGILTALLSPILGSRILIIASIVITMLGPATLLWIIQDTRISPYLYITASSAISIIKVIPIIFTALAQIASDQQRTTAFTMTVAALEASSIFTHE
jgi:hypothetical protein